MITLKDMGNFGQFKTLANHDAWTMLLFLGMYTMYMPYIVNHLIVGALKYAED